MGILKKLLIAVAATMLVAAIAGAIYEWRQSRADRLEFPAPGRLVDVDGLQLHIDCRGEGEPTLVIESGLNSGSSSWALVHDEVAATGRVCAYDRPGMDWSEPGGDAPDAAVVAQRLQQLLDAADISGPIILLGMSAGGIFVREYYHRYPDRVVGMILVDSSHEQQGDRLPDLSAALDLQTILRACAWLQPIGVVRAFGLLDAMTDQYDVPADLRALMRANAYQSHNCSSMLAESRGFEADAHRKEPPASLGDLPLTVLSQGREPEANEAFGLSLEQAQALAVVWNELQNELTALSGKGQRIIASDSGHVIQLDQPEIIVAAATSMMKRLQADGQLQGEPSGSNR